MGDEMDNLFPVLNSGSSSIKFSALAEGANQTKLKVYCDVKGVRDARSK